MAKNPKIEFYRINLTPSTEEKPDITFKDVLISKEMLGRGKESTDDSPIENDKIMPFLFDNFVKDIDGVAKKNNSKRKAFYIKQNGLDPLNQSITPLFEKNIIYGKIKGGSFDTGKYLDEIDKAGDDTVSLGKTKLLSDDFYFLLYTPLNKKRGVLILQSYTQDSISDIFRPFIQNLFKSAGVSNIATTSLFMPQEIQKEFKEKSIVKKFEYNNEYVVPALAEEGLSENQFTINVSITSNSNQINLNNLPKWKKYLGKTILNIVSKEERGLDTFNKRKGYLKSGIEKSNPTKFSLDSDNIEIKATIYLSNFINLEDNGTPKWDKLHTFALKTLYEDVIPEIYPEDFVE